MLWRCGLCMLIITITLRELLLHVCTEHSKDENFKVKCGIDGCEREYTKYKSFYSHVVNIHGHIYDGETGGGGDHSAHTVAINPSNLEAPTPPTSPLQPLLQSPQPYSDEDDDQGNEIQVCRSLHK